jgi:metal-responsive CopG/Arc/MetJ family transcriptional regulator
LGNVITSISIDEELVKKLDNLVEDRKFPGVRDRSALVEYIVRLFLEKKEA